MEKWRLWLKVVLLLIMGTAAVAWSTEVSRVEEKTFKMSADGSVSVIADEGRIEVKAWDKEEVYLKMTKRAWGRNKREAEHLLDLIEVRIQESRDQLIIKEVDRRHDSHFNFFDFFDGDFWREKGWRSGVVDFELTVPRRVQLKLQCDEGDVNVTGTEGRLKIDVDEGDVDLEDVSSEHVNIWVDEGDVTLSHVRDQGEGFWKVETDEGIIVVEDGDVYEVDVSTDEGEIILRRVKAFRFWLSTDEGDIQTDFQPMNQGNYRIETDEGDVEIFVPEETNLRVKLETGEGRIESDFDLSTRSREDGEVMEGQIGQNRGMLKTYTDEGDVLFRSK